ncbi:MAG: NCS2 family permease [Thermoguttaceae bacterium]|nr:NCS2 family permease [Thermoguttaceae bacterium]MDW8077793.1 NCS2 family permease [Thermoguttaceae bacterium]
MLDRLFRLREHNTSVRTEILAGITTFLTMAYIIVVQPAVLTGEVFVPTLGEKVRTGMDFGAVTAATCYATAISTLLLGLLANYPMAQAPGMGENFFFVLTVIPAAAGLAAVQQGQTSAWQVALGAVFISGILFLAISLLGLQVSLLRAISPTFRNGIAVGIGLFIAFIGLQNAGVIVKNPGTGVALTNKIGSLDILVFFIGLVTTAALFALRVRGAIILGILIATVLAVALRAVVLSVPELGASPLAEASRLVLPPEKGGFAVASSLVSAPPSLAPTFFRMDIVHALAWQMAPLIVILLFMDVFDTLGTLVGVAEQAGFVRENEIPRAREVLTADALGTIIGATAGTSTVTSYIESTAGVEQGGRTGLTAVVVSVLFLAALFFYPLVKMIGSYPPLTAPALVVVGAMMIRNVTKFDWDNFAEILPAFVVMLGIPLCYSIADGLALGFITYPVVKLCAGQAKSVHWLMYVLAVVLILYLVFLRA